MGNLQNVSNEYYKPSVLETKYCGKEFTPENIKNPEVFDMQEFSDNVMNSMYAYNYKTVHLVKTGIEIINDNDNFTMTLGTSIGPSGYATIDINDKNKNISTRVAWTSQHIEDRICITKNNKQVCFNDLSQVSWYFDLEKRIDSNKCKCCNDKC